MNEYYNTTSSLLRSIFSQRLLLIRFNKSKSAELEFMKLKTEQLKNELQYYCSDESIAYFLSKHYESIKLILPKSKGWEARMQKLNTLYNQSKLLFP